MANSSTTRCTATTQDIQHVDNPREIVARDLIAWLAERVTDPDRRALHEAADRALDVVENSLVENGGDWACRCE